MEGATWMSCAMDMLAFDALLGPGVNPLEGSPK
jgi:hypothetical protein